MTPLSAEYQNIISWVATRVTSGRCILFLGSAIHAPSPPGCDYCYEKDECPPIGDQLSRFLATKCDYPYADRDNLQRVSWYHEVKSTFRIPLVDDIRSAVHDNRRPSSVLRGLARLRFPIVITTNYDQLYEQALDAVAQESGLPEANYEKSVYARNDPSTKRRITKDCAQNPSQDRPFLLKIHGDIDAPDSIVITDEDYIQFVLRMRDKHPFHPFGPNLLTKLVEWPTLFIGYRLHDYNLRLLFRSLRLRLGPGELQPNYSIDLNPDILIQDAWENQKRYIKFVQRDLWDFVPKLYHEVTGSRMPA
jgi:hypothetical protein